MSKDIVKIVAENGVKDVTLHFVANIERIVGSTNFTEPQKQKLKEIAVDIINLNLKKELSK